jgi:TnpA family transposase
MCSLFWSWAPRRFAITLAVLRSRKKEDRSDWLSIPNKYINDPLIREHWDDLLRLIATIKLKETTKTLYKQSLAEILVALYVPLFRGTLLRLFRKRAANPTL